MKWVEFLKFVGDLPVVESEFLLAGVENLSGIKVQLSRWVRAGKLIQLRRGVYILSEDYRKVNVYEPYIASILQRPSYISLEKALEFHGLIPEGVPVYTSVTTKRPLHIITKIGVFDYRHIKSSLFWGYKSVVVNKQAAFVASPEKALLDFIYFKGGGASSEYIEELRLQNVDEINLNILSEYSKRFNKEFILNTAEMVRRYILSFKRKVKRF